MQIKWSKILLAASLAFNLAFVLTWSGRSRSQESREATTKDPIYNALKLNRAQEDKVGAIIKQSRIDILQFKQEILDLRMDIVEELSQPDYDPDMLREKIEALNQLESKMNHAFVETLVQISDQLNSQQRLAFMVSLGKNWFFIQPDLTVSPGPAHNGGKRP